MARTSDRTKRQVPDLFGNVEPIPVDHDAICLRLFEQSALVDVLSKIRGVDPSQLKICRKSMEQPMQENVRGDSGRVLGFADLFALHDEPDSTGRGVETQRVQTLFEVKTKWEGVGTLIRQLRFYQGCWPRPNETVVVGPDDSLADVLAEHGFPLVTFDDSGFRVVVTGAEARFRLRNPGEVYRP